MSVNKSVVIVNKSFVIVKKSVVMSPNPVYEKSHPIFILKTRVKFNSRFFSSKPVCPSGWADLSANVGKIGD